MAQYSVMLKFCPRSLFQLEHSFVRPYATVTISTSRANPRFSTDFLMSDLIHDFIFDTARRTPAAEALVYASARLDYQALAGTVRGAAGALLDSGIERGERVAIYLEKRIENVAAMFGAALAGAVFVPVNP